MAAVMSLMSDSSLSGPASIPLDHQGPSAALQEWNTPKVPWSDDGPIERVTDPPHRRAATACLISAPMSPPVGYPLPQVETSTMRSLAHPTAVHHEVDVNRDSMASSSSGSSASSMQSQHNMPPPRWAQPPAKMTSFSGRASSFDAGLDRPNVDFDPELFLGQPGEWIEVIKGESGRIAVKSTATIYEVMVWLPGFKLDDITITTRRNQILHIVADLWDENDHAQWQIKLGDDAIMTSVRAEFTGKELRVRIERNITRSCRPRSTKSNQSDVTMASASAHGSPSVSGTGPAVLA